MILKQPHGENSTSSQEQSRYPRNSRLSQIGLIFHISLSHPFRKSASESASRLAPNILKIGAQVLALHPLSVVEQLTCILLLTSTSHIQGRVGLTNRLKENTRLISELWIHKRTTHRTERAAAPRSRPWQRSNSGCRRGRPRRWWWGSARAWVPGDRWINGERIPASPCFRLKWRKEES